MLRGYEAHYADDQGFDALRIRIWWLPWEPYARSVLYHPTRIHELLIIDGHPAKIEYGSLSDDYPPANVDYPPANVTIYDKSTGIEYEVTGENASMRGDIGAVIAIARSLLPSAGAR